MIFVIIVIEALAILAHSALPVIQNTSLRCKAADIARQMSQVRTAAESARQQRNTWPDEAEPGQEPQELAAFLPPGFTFSHADYQLDWDHWQLAEGNALGAGELAGVTVITHDPRLAAMIARMLPEGETRLTLGSRTTLVIAEPGTLEH